jgi:hypothetical protein
MERAFEAGKMGSGLGDQTNPCIETIGNVEFGRSRHN